LFQYFVLSSKKSIFGTCFIKDTDATLISNGDETYDPTTITDNFMLVCVHKPVFANSEILRAAKRQIFLGGATLQNGSSCA
jgi:hypothetical protein